MTAERTGDAINTHTLSRLSFVLSSSFLLDGKRVEMMENEWVESKLTKVLGRSAMFRDRFGD